MTMILSQIKALSFMKHYQLCNLHNKVEKFGILELQDIVLKKLCTKIKKKIRGKIEFF